MCFSLLGSEFMVLTLVPCTQIYIFTRVSAGRRILKQREPIPKNMHLTTEAYCEYKNKNITFKRN